MAGINLSINNLARDLVEEMISKKQRLKISVTRQKSGTTIIDTGVAVNGSLLAGKYFALVCMSGLAELEFANFDLNGILFPAISVGTDHPVIACMASQYAGWEIEYNNFRAMASGPGRILAKKEALLDQIAYRDDSKIAVLAMETSERPTRAVCEYIAGELGISPENLYILIASTSSITGSIQISARIVETGIHKLMELDFHINQIEEGWGFCPIAPCAGNDLEAIGRTNDSILYGGSVFYTVDMDDNQLQSIINDIPSAASDDYGRNFLDLFEEYEGFYEIDPLLFSPARVTINNKRTGSVFTSGEMNYSILENSYLRAD
ncbi:MAG: methenyltetrahydromethanopterin cyclohydrolase [Bacillota bacterium]